MKNLREQQGGVNDVHRIKCGKRKEDLQNLAGFLDVLIQIDLSKNKNGSKQITPKRVNTAK